ncbi:MAG: YfcE family phosphodiesterase [Deltaproteobacteria bacterium]|nr:YfcE family phosphodiesterase [Deltaproteobacteria bacterium]
MRIGVVSDTHNLLSNVRRIVELFNAAHVERVIHTGDVTQARTVHALAALRAPLVGVYGNNDERDDLAPAAAEHGFAFHEGALRLTLAGRRIVVVHDPKDLAAAQEDEHDVALHGHDHRLVVERDAGRLRFNPGECAGHVPGLNAVGVLDLVSLEVELLRF